MHASLPEFILNLKLPSSPNVTVNYPSRLEAIYHTLTLILYLLKSTLFKQDITSTKRPFLKHCHPPVTLPSVLSVGLTDKCLALLICWVAFQETH